MRFEAKKSNVWELLLTPPCRVLLSLFYYESSDSARADQRLGRYGEKVVHQNVQLVGRVKAGVKCARVSTVGGVFVVHHLHHKCVGVMLPRNATSKINTNNLFSQYFSTQQDEQ